MVRVASPSDHANWRRALSTQVKCSPQSGYIRPHLHSAPAAATPPVVIIDIGSSAVRAGVLGSAREYADSILYLSVCASTLTKSFLQQATRKSSFPASLRSEPTARQL